MVKAQVSVQTLFYILMMVLLIGILIFGIQKIFFVQEQLSETEAFELQLELEDTLRFCEDPLNRGNFKTFRSSSSKFNTVCVLSDDLSSLDLQFQTQLAPFIGTNENVVLLLTRAYLEESLFVIDKTDVINSFSSDITVDESRCYVDDDLDGELIVRITC